MIIKNPIVGVSLNVGGCVDPIPHFKIGRYEILAYTSKNKSQQGLAVAVINFGFKEYEVLGVFSMWSSGGLEAAIFCLNALYKSDEVWEWACANFGDGHRKSLEFGSKQDSFLYMAGRLGALGWYERATVNWPIQFGLEVSQFSCSTPENGEVGQHH